MSNFDMSDWDWHVLPAARSTRGQSRMTSPTVVGRPLWGTSPPKKWPALRGPTRERIEAAGFDVARAREGATYGATSQPLGW
jgi:hypothetical protein